MEQNQFEENFLFKKSCDYSPIFIHTSLKVRTISIGSTLLVAVFIFYFLKLIVSGDKGVADRGGLDFLEKGETDLELTPEEVTTGLGAVRRRSTAVEKSSEIYVRSNLHKLLESYCLYSRYANYRSGYLKSIHTFPEMTSANHVVLIVHGQEWQHDLHSHEAASPLSIEFILHCSVTKLNLNNQSTQGQGSQQLIGLIHKNQPEENIIRYGML
ncbi:hypothetical protein SDJN02_21536, partial [Cucurbita argyrosperma subsp. argyrosperma]